MTSPRSSIGHVEGEDDEIQRALRGVQEAAVTGGVHRMAEPGPALSWRCLASPATAHDAFGASNDGLVLFERKLRLERPFVAPVQRVPP